MDIIKDANRTFSFESVTLVQTISAVFNFSALNIYKVKKNVESAFKNLQI